MGNLVNGVLHNVLGGHSEINGRIVGNRVEFDWECDFPAGRGTGELQLSVDGSQMKGTYTDFLHGTQGIWRMHRAP